MGNETINHLFNVDARYHKNEKVVFISSPEITTKQVISAINEFAKLGLKKPLGFLGEWNDDRFVGTGYVDGISTQDLRFEKVITDEELRTLNQNTNNFVRTFDFPKNKKLEFDYQEKLRGTQKNDTPVFQNYLLSHQEKMIRQIKTENNEKPQKLTNIYKQLTSTYKTVIEIERKKNRKEGN